MRGGKNFVKFSRKVLQKEILSGILSAGNTGTTNGDRKALARDAVSCRVYAPLNTTDESPRRRAYYAPFSVFLQRGGVTIGFCGERLLKFFGAALSYALNAAPCVSDSGVRGTGDRPP